MCADVARPEEESSGDGAPKSAAKRIGWMALIWAASVAALGVVSLVLRWWLK